MNNPRVRALLIALTVLALGAGVVMGMLAMRLPAVGRAGREGLPPQPRVGAGSLVQELGLTPEQAEQMRRIWEGVRSTAHECFEDARRLQKQREEATVAMLSDEQKAKYEKITRDYADSFAALTQKRNDAFDDAVERTRELLNETQRVKYEQILQNRMGGRGGGALREDGLIAPPALPPR